MNKFYPLAAVGVLLLVLALPIQAQSTVSELTAEASVTSSNISGLPTGTVIKITLRDSKVTLDVQGRPRAELSLVSVVRVSGSITIIATVVKSTVSSINFADSIQLLLTYTTVTVTDTTSSPPTAASGSLTELKFKA